VSGPDQSISSTDYSEEYFLTECDGCTEYMASEGLVLTPRLQTIWNYLDVRAGMRILDIGCGRGEIIVHCGLQGAQAVGIDYSQAGLELARSSVARVAGRAGGQYKSPGLSMANAQRLPFSGGVFDRVIMSDVVEHLYPEELQATLGQVLRVLKVGGALLVHTMPNLWYYRYGYSLFRLVQRLWGATLPANPRERFRFSHVHVNEQTPRSVGRLLERTGFSSWRVWLYDYRSYSQYGRVMRILMHLLTSTPVVNQIFCDDIFALARK
jgi:ubiquinone/menaquinone biosynthesis C-methylase UbiE